jgi:hypothetical protein
MRVCAACPFAAILADAAWRQAVMDRYERRAFGEAQIRDFGF